MARLGQNFLADPNLLAAIVRSAGLAGDEIVLEVGGGEGVLTERLAERAARVQLIELDRKLAPLLEPLAERAGNVEIVWGDAMRVDLGGLDPAPVAMVANLPYSIATPLILRTIAELPSLERWTLMVQREIADRLRASAGTKLYGSPSVVCRLACEVEFLRPVGRSVFNPRPRVDSALIALRRTARGATPGLVRIVRGAFAHRRKTLAGSLELAGVAQRERSRGALRELGLDPASRAEALEPEAFAELGRLLGSGVSS